MGTHPPTSVLGRFLVPRLVLVGHLRPITSALLLPPTAPLPRRGAPWSCGIQRETNHAKMDLRAGSFSWSLELRNFSRERWLTTQQANHAPSPSEWEMRVGAAHTQTGVLAKGGAKGSAGKLRSWDASWSLRGQVRPPRRGPDARRGPPRKSPSRRPTGGEGPAQRARFGLRKWKRAD